MKIHLKLICCLLPLVLLGGCKKSSSPQETSTTKPAASTNAAPATTAPAASAPAPAPAQSTDSEQSWSASLPRGCCSCSSPSPRRSMGVTRIVPGRRLADILVFMPMAGDIATCMHYTGIAAARGRFIVMGDSDDSYDFSALMPFLKSLRQGSDIVIGNRFEGGIDAGAMPLLHRYLGSPILAFVARLFFWGEMPRYAMRPARV